MVATLTPTELRERFETSIPDSALQDVINAEWSVITRMFGEGTTRQEVHDFSRPGVYPWLREYVTTKRIISHALIDAITSITESIRGTVRTLSADDYIVIQGYQIERVNTGSNPRNYWGDLVTVTYTTSDESALRKQVLIKLCQINLVENGYLIEKTPEFTLQTLEDTSVLRQQALNRLRRRPLLR